MKNVYCRLRDDCQSVNPHTPSNMVSVGTGHEIVTGKLFAAHSMKAYGGEWRYSSANS
jgi:hypothetical protein